MFETYHILLTIKLKKSIMSFNIITTFHFFLLVIASLIFAKPHAREIPNPKSLVLGLTYSRSSIPTPKSVTKVSKKPSQMLDMTEQLKEVRDGYIISLNLGTPPQIIQVYLDTGSDLTWVPCGNLSFDCLECDDYRNNKLTASFSPSRSSSSSRDSCSTSFCSDIHSSDNSFDTCTMSGCSLSTLIRSTCLRPCPSFAYTYGDGVVAGTLTRDILRVHESNPNYSTHEIVGFCFGCVSATYREPIGIAGFGKGPLSLPSQLGFLQKGFSHCFLPFKYANNPNFSSPLVVGELAITSKDYLQFTPMLKSPMYPNFYYIGLQSITVGNATQTQVPLSLREFDSLGNGGMIIDSGTTYTHLPEPFYTQLLAVLEGTITYPRAPQIEERSGFNLCYNVPCQSNNILDDDDGDLPPITFHFLNNASLTLPQGNTFYAMGAPSNSTVVKCLLLQSMDESDHYGPAGVFGSFQQQNVEVVYDLEKERVGFKVVDCATAAIISR